MPESLILFEVAGATYAVRSSQVEMVEMVDSITRVPGSPAFVEGVASIRGQVLPVISLRRRFHLEPVPLDLRSRVVVVRQSGRQIGMLADTAREFLRVSDESMQPVPEGLNGPGIAYLEGVVTLPGRVILLVNLSNLLSGEEQAVLAAEQSENDQNTGAGDV